MTIRTKRPQLGKIKQWSSGLGSKLSGGSGAEASSFKQDVSVEIEQRGIGNSNLYAATEGYWSYLAKKKPLPFDLSTLSVEDSASVSSGAHSAKPEGKVLPVEALGLAMTSYGSAFAESSNYGNSLAKFGEAHMRLGSLQAAFAKDTSNIFLSRIARSKAAIEAFHVAMKKLDAATAKMEAAQAKVQKSKKEKRELEEELMLAKAAYDEAVSDVETRAEAIQDSEHDDFDCLSTYMQTHIDYLAQAQAILEQAKGSFSNARATSQRPELTPLGRPRSTSGSRPQPPTLPRRASAKEPIELGLSRIKKAGSSLSLTISESRHARDGMDEYTDGETTAKRDNGREKRSILRMPSFSTAGDTVSSVASGLGAFGRSKSSSFFGSTANSESTSPDKEKAEASGGPTPSSSSKWNFMNRSRKESGFRDLEGKENLRPTEQVHNKVSSEDVGFGLIDAHDHHDVLETSARSNTSATRRVFASSNRDSLHEESPFSPGPHSAFPPLHERGETGLAMDMPLDSNYLGVNAAPQPVGMHHTGLSAYSDSGDPFSGGGHGFLSPQETGMSTGQFHTDDDYEHDDETALTGRSGTVPRRTSGAASTAAGWTRSLPFGGGNGRDYRGFDGADDTTGSVGRSTAHNTNGTSSRGPPPPVPPSSTFLNKAKARQVPPPPVPPLP